MQIALLIDIDNAKITLPVFKDVLAQLQNEGKITYCKVYGFNERKHMKFDELIEEYGFDSTPTMRGKKRAKSQLDMRLIIDAVNLCHTKPYIDAYCIIAGIGDLVPVLAFLRANNKYLYTVDAEASDGNEHMYDKHLKLNVKYNKPVKISKKELAKKLKNISERSNEISDDDEIATKQREELMQEIEDLLATKSEDLDEEEQEVYNSLEDLLDILK